MNRLSFSIAMNLVTDQFKRGATQVKNALRNIQFQAMSMVAALGAGSMGLSSLVKNFVEAARETNRANVALKNISGSSMQFAENQKFLMDLSKKYGQQINILTQNYSKFSAASSAAGMSIADQQKIYTSITRAITAFGLGADEANLAFLGVSQMIQKGKVSSEELRRQLGERIPVAMEAMARAAGVNIGQLDKLLKNGELLSKDVLPKFAEELDKLLPNVDIDNLETSVNRLKNAFIELTTKLDIQGKYKGIVDWATRALKDIGDGTSKIVALIISLITGKLLNGIIGFYKNLDAQRLAYIQKAKLAEVQLTELTAKRVAAEKALEAAKTDFRNAEAGKQYAAQQALTRAENNLKRIQLAETKAIEAQKSAAYTASALSAKTAWGGFFKTIAFGAKQAGIALLGMIKSFAPMAIISGAAYIVTSLIQARKEAEKIKNIFSDYKKSIENANADVLKQATQMQQLLAIINDKKSTQDEINAAQKKLGEMLGTEITKQTDINALVAKRIELLKNASMADAYISKLTEAKLKNQEIAKQIAGGDEMKLKRMQIDYEQITKLPPKYDRADLLNQLVKDYGLSEEFAFRRYKWQPSLGKKTIWDFENLLKTFTENEKIIKDANSNLTDAMRGSLDLTAKTISETNPDVVSNETSKEQKSDLEKEEEKYKEKLREINNLYDAEVISRKEQEELLAELNEATYKAIGGLLGASAMQNETFRTAKEWLSNYPNYTKKPIILEQERDTLFDYKKSDSEKLEEALRLKEDYISKLKEQTSLFADELNRAQAEAKDLEQALNLARVKEDLDAYKDSLKRTAADGFQNMEGMLRSFKRLQKAFTETDVSGLEKVIAILDSISTAIQGVTDMIDTIKTIQNLIQGIGAAKKAEQMIENQITAQKVSNAATEIAATRATAAATAESASTEVAANTAAAATSAGKGAAKLPFPMNIIAIGGAVAAVLAIFASLPKFASGGIVSGSPMTGDKVLARVNPGEMILNKAQQARLFRALNSGSFAKGDVKFRISGKDLVGILNQQSRLNSRM